MDYKLCMIAYIYYQRHQILIGWIETITIFLNHKNVVTNFALIAV